MARDNEEPGAPGKSEWIAFPFTIDVINRRDESAREPESSWGFRLGLEWRNPRTGEPGVVISAVAGSGPARRAGGVRTGDVVRELDGNPVADLGEITRWLDENAPGPVRFTLMDPISRETRAVELQVPAPVERRSLPDEEGPRETIARVVRTDLRGSLEQHVACILSNPLQHEVHAPGIAADPDFGCAGAGTEFSVEKVGHAAMKAAIERCERRLIDVTPSNVRVEFETSEARESRPGIRIDARLAATGSAIKPLEFVEEALAERREIVRRRSAGPARDTRTP